MQGTCEAEVIRNELPDVPSPRYTKACLQEDALHTQEGKHDCSVRHLNVQRLVENGDSNTRVHANGVACRIKHDKLSVDIIYCQKLTRSRKPSLSREVDNRGSGSDIGEATCHAFIDKAMLRSSMQALTGQA